jgi:hypothetical protein
VKEAVKAVSKRECMGGWVVREERWKGGKIEERSRSRRRVEEEKKKKERKKEGRKAGQLVKLK